MQMPRGQASRGARERALGDAGGHALRGTSALLQPVGQAGGCQERLVPAGPRSWAQEWGGDLVQADPLLRGVPSLPAFGRRAHKCMRTQYGSHSQHGVSRAADQKADRVTLEGLECPGPGGVSPLEEADFCARF